MGGGRDVHRGAGDSNGTHMLALDAFVLGGLIKPCDNKGGGSSKSQPALPTPTQCGLSPTPATTGFLFSLPSFDSEAGHLVGKAREKVEP